MPISSASATQRRYGSPACAATIRCVRLVIVWVVRLGDDLYTRSVNGPEAAWFRGALLRDRGQIFAGDAVADVDFVDGGDVDDELDAAYQRKYGRYPGPVRSITSPAARATTLKLVPHQAD